MKNSNSIHRIVRGLALVPALALLSTGCVAEGDSEDPAILAEVDVPEGFRFKTITPVEVVYQASVEQVGTGALAELRLPSGAVLSRAPMYADRPFTTKVSVPAGTKHLVASANGIDVTLQIVDGRVQAQ